MNGALVLAVGEELARRGRGFGFVPFAGACCCLVVVVIIVGVVIMMRRRSTPPPPPQ
jgi:hypothetical protein